MVVGGLRLEIFFRFCLFTGLFFSFGAHASESDDIREIYQYLAPAIAVFDIDDNALNTKGVIKIFRYEFDPEAELKLYHYRVPGTDFELPIHYRVPSKTKPILIDGPLNGRIRRLQTDGVALEDWPEELVPYFYTQLLPMFRLPEISSRVVGSRFMESTVSGMPNQFLAQIRKNYRKGILLDAPMTDILRRFLAKPQTARDVGFITSRRHEDHDMLEGFAYLVSHGVFDYLPNPTMIRAIGNPLRNPSAHDPNVKLALLKRKELSEFMDLAARTGKPLFFSDDDPANFNECLDEFIQRRARGELQSVSLLMAYTGHSPIPGLSNPVVLIRPGDPVPAYFPLSILLRAGQLLPEPSQRLDDIRTPRKDCAFTVRERGQRDRP
jgi:hypothetical protein